MRSTTVILTGTVLSLLASAVFAQTAGAAHESPSVARRPEAATTTQGTPVRQVPQRQRIPIDERKPEDVGGMPCKNNNDCPTRECWDGFCCNESCSGRCRSCALPGRKGICSPVPDGQDPRRDCTTHAGGHPACDAACYSGRCAVPDVGTPCGTCAACNGVGRCEVTPPDDDQCGVVNCDGLDNYCRNYHDLHGSRCASLGVCKVANDPATCVLYTNLYSGVTPAGVRRECATGKVMNCYRRGTRWMWQDGSVIKDCNTGEVCVGCAPPSSPRPEDWAPPKARDQRPD